MREINERAEPQLLAEGTAPAIKPQRNSIPLKEQKLLKSDCSNMLIRILHSQSPGFIVGRWLHALCIPPPPSAFMPTNLQLYFVTLSSGPVVFPFSIATVEALNLTHGSCWGRVRFCTLTTAGPGLASFLVASGQQSAGKPASKEREPLWLSGALGDGDAD